MLWREADVERKQSEGGSTAIPPSSLPFANLVFGRTTTALSEGVVPPYKLGEILGNGSFGVVCRAELCGEEETVVAIKRVLQDPRYKNRELEIMRKLHHRNVVDLKDYFYTEVKTSDGVQRYLNVVMEYIPETVYRVLKAYNTRGKHMPLRLVQTYMFQLLRSVGYLHSKGICHRDLKPQNLLLDTESHVLKLCDFGSAKQLIPRETSVSYICSRFYRAPELMLGCTRYTHSIDLWSVGCVLGELILGKPLFPGDTSVDQLVKIIEVLGTPNRIDMEAMNNSYMDFKFPEVQRKPWQVVFGGHRTGYPVPESALDLLNKLLRYNPESRIQAYDALAHSFFDDLRVPDLLLSEGPTVERPKEVVPAPVLFDLSEDELSMLSTPTLRQSMIPSWM